MPLFKSITIPDGLLAVWQIAESSDELLSFFNPEEITDPAFQKFNYEKRKVEWLATRALLKQMIGSGFDISYSEVGKPIINHPIYQHISISHSRDFVAVIIHQKLDVGIDIEDINRNYSSVKKRYLSDFELDQVNNNVLLQCVYWCAKEAVFKLVEDEGVEFRKQIQVIEFNHEQDFFFVRFFSGNQGKIYKLQYTTFNQHCLVWTCNAEM
jgi:4'-phosphopantetheinyl transferase EntD